jgi:hypothetical protein
MGVKESIWNVMMVEDKRTVRKGVEETKRKVKSSLM